MLYNNIIYYSFSVAMYPIDGEKFVLQLVIHTYIIINNTFILSMCTVQYLDESFA